MIILRTSAILLAGLVYTGSCFAQTSPSQRAQAAYTSAQAMDASLDRKATQDRSRADYLKVVNAYQRVYLITPHTSYADDSLIAIARLYEAMEDVPDALKTLDFLLRQYPQTPFKEDAEKNVDRLQGFQPVSETRTRTVSNSAANGAGGNTAASTVTIDDVRYWESPNSVRVIIDVSGEVRFKQGEAKNPDRVFLDIGPAKISPALAGKQWPVKSGLLQKIRVGKYDNSTVRVVLDLAAAGKATSFTLRDPDRLVIDIQGRQPAATINVSRTAAPAATTAAVPALSAAAIPALTAAAVPALKPAPLSPTPWPVDAVDAPAPAPGTIVSPTPAPPSKIAPTPKLAAAAAPLIVTPAKPTTRGDRSLIRSLGLKISRVVIDAGHGGHDTGTIGPTGYMEKDLVLDVSRRLRDLIEKEMGADVVMTRSEDVFVPLEERTAAANRQEADLFISIHANASPTKTVRGVETFFLNLPSSREALEIASRENAASQKGIHELHDVVNQIMLSNKVNESRELAEHIQKAMAGRKDSGQNRGVKQAPFVVLVGANMPSILAEIAFISNPQEERSIKTPQYRQQIAESLFEGVKSYAETLSGIKTAKTQEKN